jgi:membrane protein DedA with SNARE-associated domain
MSLFETFTEGLESYGYPVLFIGVLLENAGIPVPGETAVLLAGYLSSPAGGGRLHILGVIVVTVVAAVLGDNLGYWLGREWARPRLQAGRRFLFLTPRTLELAEGYFHRYGLWTIFFARFISGLRVVGALAAGTAGMPWGRFVGANAAGALAWAVSMSLLGYFFGHSFELLHHWLGRGGAILLGAVLVLVGLPYALRRLRKLSLGTVFDPARAQIGQGLIAAVLETTCIALIVFQAQGRHPNPLDRGVEEFVFAHSSTTLDSVAEWLGFIGSLPIVTLVSGAVVALLWRDRRPRREMAAMIAAWFVSEALGLVLVGLLRYHRAEPVKTMIWPFGFAGSMPLRALAVYGMAAWLLGRAYPTKRWLGVIVAGGLVALSALGVVWAREQAFTEALLELAAGGLVLFAAIWWLEGYTSVATAGPASPSAAPTSEAAQTGQGDAGA